MFSLSDFFLVLDAFGVRQKAQRGKSGEGETILGYYN